MIISQLIDQDKMATDNIMVVVEILVQMVEAAVAVETVQMVIQILTLLLDAEIHSNNNQIHIMI